MDKLIRGMGKVETDVQEFQAQLRKQVKRECSSTLPAADADLMTDLECKVQEFEQQLAAGVNPIVHHGAKPSQPDTPRKGRATCLFDLLGPPLCCACQSEPSNHLSWSVGFPNATPVLVL